MTDCKPITVIHKQNKTYLVNLKQYTIIIMLQPTIPDTRHINKCFQCDWTILLDYCANTDVVLIINEACLLAVSNLWQLTCYLWNISSFYIIFISYFNVLTLLVWQQEGRDARRWSESQGQFAAISVLVSSSFGLSTSVSAWCVVSVSRLRQGRGLTTCEGQNIIVCTL